jgi:chemotaxis protein CheZ
MKTTTGTTGRMACEVDGAQDRNDRSDYEFLAALAIRPNSPETEPGTTAFSSMAAWVNASNLNPSFLRSELEKMASAIVQTQREIAGIKPNVAGPNRVASATEELAMVVSTTEEAATSILTIAERLQQIEGELAKAGADASLCSEIGSHATNLMIACSFQDVTGQRMTKAAKALQFIEERVNGLIEIWGVTASNTAEVAADPDDDSESALLNGPARDGEGVTQEEIDRLIESGMND